MGISAKQAPKILQNQIDRAQSLPGPRNCRQVSKGMNKLEEKFAKELEMMKSSGEILEYFFEHIKLRLGHNTFYSPDFLVVAPQEFRIFEVKGHWEDDARVKIKWGARLYWFFRFHAVQKKRGEWKIEEIKT